MAEDNIVASNDGAVDSEANGPVTDGGKAEETESVESGKETGKNELEPAVEEAAPESSAQDATLDSIVDGETKDDVGGDSDVQKASIPSKSDENASGSEENEVQAVDKVDKSTDAEMANEDVDDSAEEEVDGAASNNPDGKEDKGETPVPPRPIKRARTAYFIFAEDKRPAIQAEVCIRKCLWKPSCYVLCDM